MFAQLVSLPDNVKVGIVMAITAALGYLFTLIPVFGVFLQGYKGQIALVLGGVVVAFIEAQTPDIWGNVVILGSQLVLAILAVFGVVVAVKFQMGHYEQGIR